MNKQLSTTDAALIRSLVRHVGLHKAAVEFDVTVEQMRTFLQDHPSRPGEWMH